MNDEITDIFNQGMLPSVRSLIFQFLFYGVYVTLSVACILLQVQQRRVRNKKLPHPFYPISLIALFILATAGIILSIYDVVNVIQIFTAAAAGYTLEEVLPWERHIATFRMAISSIYATANWITDLILLHRCYHVWNGKIWILIFPGVLSIINAGTLYASIATIETGSDELFATQHSREVIVGDDLNYVFLGVNVFENLLLTGLIAGRIWWVNRIHSKLLGTERRDKRLNAIVTMFVESGVIYPIALVVCLIIQVKGSPATMDPILLQIVGIAPTFILIRTSLGLGVHLSSPSHHRDQEVLGANLQDSSAAIKVKRTMPWTVDRRDCTGQPSSDSYYATTPFKSLGSMQYGDSNDYRPSHPTSTGNSERMNTNSSPISARCALTGKDGQALLPAPPLMPGSHGTSSVT